METISGTGKLYDTNQKQVIATVDYTIWYKPPTKFTLGEWHGRFVLEVNNVVSLGEYILILQDNRKGKISISRMEMQPDATIDYEFQGSGPLR
jgi:hypothetical protein